jgi:hypothetical protein
VANGLHPLRAIHILKPQALPEIFGSSAFAELPKRILIGGMLPQGEYYGKNRKIFCSGAVEKEQSMRKNRLQDSETGSASAKCDSRQRGIACRLTMALLGAALLCLVMAPVVEAVPKRIIILRHGEKQNGYALCPVGQQRSLALAANYLGKGAAKSLFPRGTKPAAIFAATLHCLELADPTAQSWGMPMQLFSVVPLDGLTKDEETIELNKRTQQAARSLLTDPRWNGKTVIVFWEHDHIAKTSLEELFYYEKVTLRQLLNLYMLPNVPPDWHGGNYDYFWIVDYGIPGLPWPTKFTLKKQEFPPPYDTVPSNDWGTPEDLPEDSGCEP